MPSCYAGFVRYRKTVLFYAIGCISLYSYCVYRDCFFPCFPIGLDCLFRLARAVLACGVLCFRSVGSVCSCRSCCVARVVLCVRALFAVVIWCTRVIMRCNRFSVLDGIVLSCALSCDCGAFYKCLLCCRLMV